MYLSAFLKYDFGTDWCVRDVLSKMSIPFITTRHVLPYSPQQVAVVSFVSLLIIFHLIISLGFLCFPFKHDIMAPSNMAAFLVTKGTPLKVQPSTYTPPAENQIVVKNGAIAINPYDSGIQTVPNLLVP